jgi:predicted transcriptional regulator
MLSTMERYGLVEMQGSGGKRRAPKVRYSRFKLEMPLGAEPDRPMNAGR